MPPRGRGGGKGGNKAYSGSHKGPKGERASKIIDLTGGGLGATGFGNPLLFPMMQTPMTQFPGMGGLHLMQTFGNPGLVGPQTNMCFAPTGPNTDANSAAWIMQQQMLMAQMSSVMQKQQSTVQVKITEADLQALQMQKMHQQFAYMQALQEHMTHAQGKESKKDDTNAVNEVHSDGEDNQTGDGLDRQLVDIAKHESRQKEVDKIMNESLAQFLSDDKYKDNPQGALEACRLYAKEQSEKSTPVKNLEEMAQAVSHLVSRQLSAAFAAMQSQEARQSEAPRDEPDESNGSRSEGGSASDVLERLAALEARYAGNTAPKGNTPVTPVTGSLPSSPFMNNPTNFVVPTPMSWATLPTAYHNLMQQQQAAMMQSGTVQMPTSVGLSSDTVMQQKQGDPYSAAARKEYDLVMTGEDEDKPGMAWITTRSGPVPISRKSTKSKDETESEDKFISGLHVDLVFEPNSLKSWQVNLDKGPQPTYTSPEQGKRGENSYAEYVFWRLCYMINSVCLNHGPKILEAKIVPKAAEQLVQSYRDRLYKALQPWYRSHVISPSGPGKPGPNLHKSLCLLLVMKGVYKRTETCPSQPLQMLNRLLCILYKGGVPFSDEVFGLQDGGSKSKKRHRAANSIK